MLKLDLTSAVLKNQAAWDLSTLHEVQKIAADNNFELGIQIHNSASQAELDTAAETGLPLSFHAPVMGEYMMNFAAADCREAWQMAEEQSVLMKKYAVTRAVFHGGLMTDLPIYAFGHGMSYNECMQKANRSDLLREEQGIFVRNYTQDEEFLRRRELLKKNLVLLRKRYPDFVWCVENDFPAHAALVLRGSDLAYIEHDMCLDTGHLWAASKMLDLDFYGEIEAALASGRGAMIHLHASKYTFDMPHSQWGDGHLPLQYPGKMDIERVVQMCREAKMPHFVLETGEASPDDVKIFLRYYYGK